MKIARLTGAAAALCCTAAVALLPNVAAEAATSNVCKLAGITKAVGKKVFGPGVKVEYLSQYSPTLCEVIPKDSAYAGSLEVYLYEKSQYAEERGGVAEHGDRIQKLRNLGSGAIYSHNKDYSVDAVLFRAGAYTVELDNNEAGGQAKKVYPTEREYLILARAIHAHLR